MIQNKEYGSAGDLLKEVQEMQKVAQTNDVVEKRDSTTALCGAFMSIWCC